MAIQAKTTIGMVAALVLEATAPAAACPLETFATASPATVVDGRTFRLDDGREVRLAAIEAPAPDGQPGTAARLALEKLLAGNRVVLKRLTPATDRYGRLVAHAFVLREGSEYWLEREMIAAGHARVAARVGNPACATALIDAEKRARTAQLGLWTDPYYALRRADNAAELRAEQGRFTVVEGKVLSVREVGSTIYVNFGRVWSRNLTVTISKRNLRAFTAAGVEPKKLENRNLRVRGWIEERSGPRIEALWPEQIEIADR